MKAVNLREVTLAQRMMGWGILVWPIGFIPPVFFVTIPFQLYGGYRLARALDLDTSVTVIVMLMIMAPLICLLAMLWIHHRATSTLREAGIPVGWFGARIRDLPLEGAELVQTGLDSTGTDE